MTTTGSAVGAATPSIARPRPSSNSTGMPACPRRRVTVSGSIDPRTSTARGDAASSAVEREHQHLRGRARHRIGEARLDGAQVDEREDRAHDLVAQGEHRHGQSQRARAARLVEARGRRHRSVGLQDALRRDGRRRARRLARARCDGVARAVVQHELEHRAEAPCTDARGRARDRPRRRAARSRVRARGRGRRPACTPWRRRGRRGPARASTARALRRHRARAREAPGRRCG